MPFTPTLLLLLMKLAFWLCAGVVTILSLLPVAYLPPQAFDIWDKAQHAGGFAALALLGHFAYPRRLWRICLGLLAYGASIEVAQSATGWRHGDGLDLLADGAGIVLGTVLLPLIRRIGLAPSRQ
jgi:VanZ family protein